MCLTKSLARLQDYQHKFSRNLCHIMWPKRLWDAFALKTLPVLFDQLCSAVWCCLGFTAHLGVPPRWPLQLKSLKPR